MARISGEDGMKNKKLLTILWRSESDSTVFHIYNICLRREGYPEDGERPEVQWETPTKLPHLAATRNEEIGMERYGSSALLNRGIELYLALVLSNPQTMALKYHLPGSQC
jgi:hypothetical protein